MAAVGAGVYLGVLHAHIRAQHRRTNVPTMGDSQRDQPPQSAALDKASAYHRPAELECCASEVQSQDLEDMHILEILLLAAKHEGQKTFVELGALDGKTLSNTYMLERCFGWHGLLIEGSPQNFEKLKQNRPSAEQCSEKSGHLPPPVELDTSTSPRSAQL